MKKLLSLLSILLCLGVFTGCSSNSTTSSVTTIEVCNDPSNAIRAFQLLEAKGVVAESDADSFYKGEELTVSGSKWTSSDGKVEITLVEESLLVSSMGDYDYACLPCNTAYTGNVNATKRVAVEDDPEQVAAKANIIAARVDDYANDSEYRIRIDALTDAMLSEEVSAYFAEKYLGAMTCDSSSQIDLRETASEATVAAGENTVIKVCASDVPHAEVLENCVKDLLAAQGYTLEVTVLDWTLQNDAVANGDYDANYFQHVPYLNTYEGTTKLFATCKVHYEPLGIYSDTKTVSDFTTLTTK